MVTSGATNHSDRLSHRQKPRTGVIVDDFVDQLAKHANANSVSRLPFAAFAFAYDHDSHFINLGDRHFPDRFGSLIGGSGCGKSTLLRIIGGLDNSHSGTIELDGEPIRGPGSERGLVFQEPRLFPWLTVTENIAFGLSGSKQEKREQVEHLLRLVGLAGFASAYPHQLSGGMAQRAAIARAIINRPEILLMNEPFGALDAFTRIQMQEGILNIWRNEGATVVLGHS